MKLEFTDYEVQLLRDALSEVYKQHGAHPWALKGPEGKELAGKINTWFRWAVCEIENDDTRYISQSALCHYFSGQIGIQLIQNHDE